MEETSATLNAIGERGNEWAYFDGNIVPISEIHIHPKDLGLLRGYAIFDVLPVEHGKPFLWDRHYDRMKRAAEKLRLHIPLEKEMYHEALARLIEAAGAGSWSLRSVLTGGPSVSGFMPEPGKETFFILAEHRHVPDGSVYEKGVKLITLEYERHLPKIKFANHAVSIWDLDRRIRENAFDTLYVSEGIVTEASQGNVLIVRDGALITPQDEVLGGIVQGLAMELARKTGLTPTWRSISLKETLAADEVLLTGSSKGIVPVVRIDKSVIGSGEPGPSYRSLKKAYDDFVARY